MTSLFHASSWGHLTTLAEGDEFTLNPGPQSAEGSGVYFSEGSERASASDSVYESGRHAATIVLEAECATGWWRSKRSALKKKNRTRTWHSSCKAVKCQVLEIKGHLVYCQWSFVS